MESMSFKAQAFAMSAILSADKTKRKHPERPEDEEDRKPTTLPSIPAKVKRLTSAEFSKPAPGCIHAELLDKDLWQQFFQLGTEMIITKAGRRMFPSLKVGLENLEDDSYYIAYLEIEPLDDKRYRYVYQNSQWSVASSGDTPPPWNHRCYVHPDVPAKGRQLRRIVFDRLKLTNSRKPSLGQISLHSMHKYRPKLYVQKLSSEDLTFLSTPDASVMDVIHTDRAQNFEFSETAFITVTAYQNQEITRLKIASNPFAKGFRENTRESFRGLDSISPMHAWPTLMMSPSVMQQHAFATQNPWYNSINLSWFNPALPLPMLPWRTPASDPSISDDSQ